MKKFSIFAVLTGVLYVVPHVVSAAYSAYPAYATGQMTVPSNGQMMYPSSGNRAVMGMPAYNMPYNQAAAAQPNRVTGALPRVGSSQTAAGRSYYQPANYDRLADSGL